MTPEQQLETAKRHYALQSSGRQEAAEELLTDDFVITIPPSMPFAGVFHGKQASRELIPLVASTVAVAGMEFVATTVGDDHVVELVRFTLDGCDSPVMVAEVNRFRGDQICEIQPFYPDPAPWHAAAERRRASADSAG